MFHHREDYIVRLLSTISLVAAKVLRLRLDLDYSGALTVLDSTADAHRLSGMEHLSADAIMEMLDSDRTTGSLRGLLLALLLEEKANTLAEQHSPDEAQDTYAKAFQLYYRLLYVYEDTRLEDELTDAEWQEQLTRLRDLTDKLDHFAMPLDAGCDLMYYYEDVQEFDKAEDVLFTLLERTDHDSEITALGIEYYERLLELDDVTLSEGNLPRNEVEESLQELQA